jgi:hypothetical protein
MYHFSASQKIPHPQKKGCAVRTPTPTERLHSGLAGKPKTMGGVWMRRIEKN